METVSAPKVGIYLRQSYAPNGDILAVTRQREDVTKLCGERGWLNTLEYVDNDFSATSGKRRPAYQKMLGDIRDGRIDAIAVWDLDRLYRQPRELEDLIYLADAKQLVLASVTGDADLSTDNGRLFARIKGAVGKSEVERKTARQKRAAQQRAEAGKAWTPVRWFGYTSPNRDGTGVQLVASEAKLLRKAYTDVLAGRSLMGIVRDWNDKGIKTTRGNPWVAKVLRDVLLNARNAGIREYRGQRVAEGCWAAIVDEDIYLGVKAVLTDPSRACKPHNGYGRRYLLSRIAVCGVCGSTVSSTIPGNTKGARYACRHCGKVVRSVAQVDSFVTALIVERLSRSDAADLLIAQQRDDVGALRDRAAALRARQDELAALFASGDITATQLKTGTASLTGQLAEVESKMLDANKVHVFDGVIGVKDVRAKFDRLPLDRRRALINALLTLTIMPGQPSRGPLRTDLIRIDWK